MLEHRLQHLPTAANENPVADWFVAGAAGAQPAFSFADPDNSIGRTGVAGPNGPAIAWNAPGISSVRRVWA